MCVLPEFNGHGLILQWKWKSEGSTEFLNYSDRYSAILFLLTLSHELQAPAGWLEDILKWRVLRTKARQEHIRVIVISSLPSVTCWSPAWLLRSHTFFMWPFVDWCADEAWPRQTAIGHTIQQRRSRRSTRRSERWRRICMQTDDVLRQVQHVSAGLSTIYHIGRSFAFLQNILPYMQGRRGEWLRKETSFLFCISKSPPPLPHISSGGSTH